MSYKGWYDKYVVDKTNYKGYNKNIEVNLQLFANKDILKQTDRQILKGIRNTQKQIEIHRDNISNPYRKYANWESFSEDRKNRELKHWETEIKAFEKNIQDAIDELKNRGVDIND